MIIDRHPATDLIHKKLVDLIEEWMRKGYSLEKIGDMCELSTPLIYGLTKKPDHPGYKGARLTVNTAVKIWTGLGNPLHALFTEADDIQEESKEVIKLVEILSIDKQVLELDERIMDTVLKRRAISPKKLSQIEKLLTCIREILWQMSLVLDRLKSVSSSK